MAEMIYIGFLHKNGRAQCGGCGVTEGPTHGGKRERKADGWRYDPSLGWLCRWCSHWARRNGGDVDNSPRIVENSANVENSRRFGPASMLQRITVPNGTVILSAAFMRSARRRNNRRRRLHTAKADGTHIGNARGPDHWPSSRWRSWKRQRRADRSQEEGSEP